MQVYVYRKSNEPLEMFKKSLQSVLQNPGDIFLVHTESDRGYMTLKRVEEEIEEGDVWIVASVNNLGNTVQDICNELCHIARRGIVLLITNYPSMSTFHSKEKSLEALNLLCDVYKNIPNQKISFVSAHPIKTGRKKKTYPEGWSKLYEEWKEKRITSAEFLKKSGLKKATFYNLLGEYRIQSSTFSKVYRLKDVV